MLPAAGEFGRRLFFPLSLLSLFSLTSKTNKSSLSFWVGALLFLKLSVASFSASVSLAQSSKSRESKEQDRSRRRSSLSSHLSPSFNLCRRLF